MTPRYSSFLAVLMAAAPLAVSAQGLGDAAAAVMPQAVSIKIGTGATAKTVSQTSVPFVFVLPLTSRFNVDLATAFASSDVSVNGKSVSSISGLTDTQVRANLTLGNDAVVFTIGANLPTGQYQIATDKADAAGQIGNDFLIFPTSSYGSGLSTTGGVAVARTLGTWNFGLAGSFRKSTEFDAYTSTDGSTKQVLTFTPADEVRARIGADRSIGDGRLALGVTYSTFGSDVLSNTTYSTGDRFIGQGSLYYPVGGADVYLSGWGLYRAKGQQYLGEAPSETVANGAAAVGFRAGSWYIEPNIEARSWQVDGYKAGLLGNGGVRLRYTTGAFTFMPSATYHVGTLYTLGGGETFDVTGWRASVMLRLH
ncbi:MAG: hypothetical protein HYV19_08915 [Gemmatimonadetes bacterium]|nr:hypothetical protein [Gemmatimonadota bacterium]